MGATSDNIKGVILDVMGRYEGFNFFDMASKSICPRCDGDLVFQGIRFGVITQTKEQIAPFLIGVHCVAHRTNLGSWF
jgi:hypothetical protein